MSSLKPSVHFKVLTVKSMWRFIKLPPPQKKKNWRVNWRSFSPLSLSSSLKQLVSVRLSHIVSSCTPHSLLEGNELAHWVSLWAWKVSDSHKGQMFVSFCVVGMIFWATTSLWCLKVSKTYLKQHHDSGSNSFHLWCPFFLYSWVIFRTSHCRFEWWDFFRVSPQCQPPQRNSRPH